MVRLAIVPVVLVMFVGGALAQESADTAPLPPICTSGSMPGMHGGDAGHMEMDGMAMPGMGADTAQSGMPMDEAHKAMMAGMDKMQADMMAGMMAEDIDVAFVCGMIPHHQGAIAMARAELQYGKDPENKALAEAIIKAQEAEITQMLDWLAKKAK